MRTAISILTALLLIPLFGVNLQCSEAGEPESVIVPVGEPDYGGDDPYDGEGDLGCGSDSGATSATLTNESEDGERLVLVTFIGTNDIWLVMVTLTEYQALRVRLDEIYGPEQAAQLDHQDVDDWHRDLCAPDDGRSEEGELLYRIFHEVLDEKMDDIAAEICL